MEAYKKRIKHKHTFQSRPANTLDAKRAASGLNRRLSKGISKSSGDFKAVQRKKSNVIVETK